MTESKIATQDQKTTPTVSATHTGATYVPDVDIRENEDGIYLVADMPGVDQESVDVMVENNVLTIEGRAHSEPPKGYELVGQEYGVGSYRRDFTLASSVDTAGIKARVRHGVLEIAIPKREELRSRKIEIGS